MKKYIMEFIGTFFLLLGIVLSVAKAGAFAPIAIGSMLMVMVYAGGHVSGAHYNPAVTIAVYLRGKCKATDIPGYISAQLAGGVLAALIGNYLLGETPIPAGIDINQAIIAEFLGTFALVFVILNVATAKATEGNSYFGLAIGFTVAAAAFALGGFSGGAFNPAVAIAGSIAGLFSWGLLWMYLIVQVVAAIVATFIFKATQN